MNDTPYINRSAVKKLALLASKNNRGGKFTRVGSTFFDRLNAQIAVLTTIELNAEKVPLYINRSAIKKLATRIIEEKKLDSKMDAATLQRINRRLMDVIVAEVHRHPSMGKTLQ